MTHLRMVLGVLGLLALAGPALAQQDFSKVEIKVNKIADGIYMLEGQGGNMGLSVGKDATFLIDDQFGPLSDKIKAAIATVADKPVKFLMNTHWHGDHVGGNENFGKSGAIIIAQDNVRKRLREVTISRGQPREPSPPAALPVITFGEDVTLYINDMTIHGMHMVPTHTDGDTLVYFEEANVLHTGDTYVHGTYPFVDQESGGNFDGFIATTKKILALANDNTKIIPGHGPLSTKADVEETLKVLTTMRSRVEALVKKNMSRDEVIKADPMPEYRDTWGAGFMGPDAIIGAAYDAVTKSMKDKT